MGELRGRWWNGKYGRIARVDIWLYVDGSVWRVRGRLRGDGGPEVNYEYWDPGGESRARLMVSRLIERSPGGGDGWRDLTTAVRRANDRHRYGTP